MKGCDEIFQVPTYIGIQDLFAASFGCQFQLLFMASDNNDRAVSGLSLTYVERKR